MDTALLLARLVLAAVFVVAGVAKLADRSGSRQAMRGFGVPERLAAPAGLALPIAEIAVAVLLLPLATAWWAGLGALVLLLAFVLGIGYNLARGRQPDCHCFGQLHSEPAGVATLIRNGVLAAVAAFVVTAGSDDPGSSLVGWADDLSAAGWVALVIGALGLMLLAAEGWALVHLLGQNGRLLLRLDALEEALAGSGAAVGRTPTVPAPQPPPGLAVGSPAPAFSLSGLHGETMTLDALRAAGKPVLLIFSDPNCGPCNGLLPDIGRWQREHSGVMTVALITRGKPEANRSKSAEHGIAHVLLQSDREVAQAYMANGTPTAILVRADGTIGSPPSPGADAIRQLVARTVGSPAPVPAAIARTNGNGNGSVDTARPAPQAPAPGATKVGQPAPTLKLPDLDGNEVDLASFKGAKTLVLFWNPGCGFCSRMLDDLKSWEAAPPASAPKLLVVSTGTPEANRAMGLRSTVVLDQGFNGGRAFGASGTPSAVLVDAKGNLASPVAVGAPNVLALARGEEAPAPAENRRPAARKVGEKAPEVKLPDLNGKMIDLASHRGTKTLVLFWNPGCGFCNRMLDDLKAWEAKPPKGAPKLFVISTGTVEANKAMDLRSPVVLDQGFSAGSAFGASGTPSAVLVDAKGNLASEVAVGAPAVLALAGTPQDQAKPTVV